MTERHVAVVIPALDEEHMIGQVVSSVRDSPCVSSVIVVDNGSVDETALAARDAGAHVVAEPRRGYGYACAAGSAEAVRQGADIIVTIDGDGSSRATELESLVGPIIEGRADLVLGSRVLGTIAPGAMPPHQRAGNRVISLLMRVFYRCEVTDLGPFRAIGANLLSDLDMREMTFGWPTEMMVKVAVRGGSIVEVPVSWDRRGGGKSKVGGNLKGSVLAAVDIVRVTLRYARRGASSR